MTNKILLNYNFQPGDRILHPRLGVGLILRRENDGKCVVKFDKQCKKDVIYPNQLIPLNRITRFILSVYCEVCNTELSIDLTSVGDTAEPGFKSVSLLPRRSPEVQLAWDFNGRPLYKHRCCGATLIPGEARPVMK